MRKWICPKYASVCTTGHVCANHLPPTPFFQIQLRAEDLYDKDKVDLETIVVDDVFKLLQCTEAGLDSAEATRRLELFGPNRLESEEQNPFLQVSVSIRHSLDRSC